MRWRDALVRRKLARASARRFRSRWRGGRGRCRRVSPQQGRLMIEKERRARRGRDWWPFTLPIFSSIAAVGLATARHVPNA